MKKAMVLVFLIALSIPIFAAVVTSEELTSMYGVSYDERQASNFIEKDGYTFEYLGDGKWEVTRVSGSSSSRSSSSRSMARNWISGEYLFLYGLGAHYDFQINNMFSVGASVYYSWFFFIMDNWGIQASGRFYPGVMGNTLYTGLGLGFGSIDNLNLFSDDSWWFRTTGLLVTPSLGWKFRVGKRNNPGGFFINPELGVPIVFGTKKYYDWWDDEESGKFNVDWAIKLGVGFGVAF